jgi:HSP20 family protein
LHTAGYPGGRRQPLASHGATVKRFSCWDWPAPLEFPTGVPIFSSANAVSFIEWHFERRKENIMGNLLTRYDPIDDFFRGFFVRPVEFGSPPDAPSMKIDVKEQDKAFVVHAEMPGIPKEDIHVNIDGPIVSISAERKQEKEVKDGERVLRSERYFGEVSRSFQLGQDVDDTQAVAKFTDGVLELTLPKKAASQAKRLTIE